MCVGIYKYIYTHFYICPTSTCIRVLVWDIFLFKYIVSLYKLFYSTFNKEKITSSVQILDIKCNPFYSHFTKKCHVWFLLWVAKMFALCIYVRRKISSKLTQQYSQYAISFKGRWVLGLLDISFPVGASEIGFNSPGCFPPL